MSVRQPTDPAAGYMGETAVAGNCRSEVDAGVVEVEAALRRIPIHCWRSARYATIHCGALPWDYRGRLA